jgi:hypothetical protein
MLRRHARVAIDEGLRRGDEQAALTAATSRDPLLRRLVRRKLGRTLLSAMSQSELAGAGGTPEASAHTLRASALLLEGRRDVDLAQRDAVARAFAELRPVRPPLRAPWLTGLLTAALVAGVVLGVVWFLGQKAPLRYYDRIDATPARADAFTKGGRPPSDPALASLLRGPLTEHLLAVNHDVISSAQRGRIVPAGLIAERATLAAAPAIVAAGPVVLAAWQDFLTAIGEWHALPGGPGMNGRYSDAARALSAALATAGLGFYVDGDVYQRGDDRHELVLYSYQVVDVAFVQGQAAAPMRVLTLQRLDQLNIERAALGMQSKELGDPLVLLDQIEDRVATHDLPVLGALGHFQVGDDAFEKRGDDVAALLTAIDTRLRRDTLAALGPHAPAAARIGAALTERRRLMGMMKSELKARGWRMGTLEGVFLPEDFLPKVAPVIDEEQLAPLRKIEDALLADDAARLAVKVEDLVIASIRRHEAQHAYDDQQPLGYPPVLEQRCGPLAYGAEDSPFALSCQAELSAYLSQIASDAMPQQAVWSMARHTFDRTAWGSAMALVSTVALLELGVELKAPAPARDVFAGRSIDRAAVISAAEAIVAATDDDLRRAAGAAWTRLYGRPYVPLGP